MDTMAEKDPLTSTDSLLSGAMDKADTLTAQDVAEEERLKAAQTARTALDEGSEEQLIRRAAEQQEPDQ
jgi:hypothetical protein